MWNSAAIEIQWLHEQERQQRPSAHFSFFPDIEFLTSTKHYILSTVPSMWGVRNACQAKLNPNRIPSWENGNGNFRIGLNWCFGQTPRDSSGQGHLSCCSPWGCKELDTMEWLNWTELKTQKLACLLSKLLRIGRNRRTENKVSMNIREVLC